MGYSMKILEKFVNIILEIVRVIEKYADSVWPDLRMIEGTGLILVESILVAFIKYLLFITLMMLAWIIKLISSVVVIIVGAAILFPLFLMKLNNTTE